MFRLPKTQQCRTNTINLNSLVQNAVAIRRKAPSAICRPSSVRLETLQREEPFQIAWYFVGAKAADSDWLYWRHRQDSGPAYRNNPL